MSIYQPTEFRPEICMLHNKFLKSLTEPGLFLNSHTRIEVAKECRASRNCPFSFDMKDQPFDTNIVTGYPSKSILPVGYIDLIRRTMNGAGRLVLEEEIGKEYFTKWCSVHSPGEYVEIVAVTVMMCQVDTFHLALGLPLVDFPMPIDPTEPMKQLASDGLGEHSSWVPTMDPLKATGKVYDTYTMKFLSKFTGREGPKRQPESMANILKQLSAIPDDHQQFAMHCMIMYAQSRAPGRPLKADQVEFIAARTSKINDCAY